MYRTLVPAALATLAANTAAAEVTYFDTRAAWEASAYGARIIEDFNGATVGRIGENQPTATGELTVEFSNADGGTGWLFVREDSVFDGTNHLNVQLDGNPKSTLTITFPEPVTAWSANVYSPVFFGAFVDIEQDGVRHQVQLDSQTIGFIGFVSDEPVTEVVLQDAGASWAGVSFDDVELVPMRVASPSAHSIATLGEAVDFALASNADAGIVWSSNIDGVLGTEAAFSTTELSEGLHTISVTDGTYATSFSLLVIEALRGEQGPAGADGADGAQGPAGADGAQGPAGADGADGAQGPAGADGADGAQGPQGEQGPAGADGAQGPQGEVGPQGPAGADGADGAQGPQGEQGPAGADGAQGPQGEQGPAGADGAQGPQGEQGPAGADGAQGPQGEQGPAGADGAQGPQGPAGADGAQGEQGPAGADGAQGPQGEVGPQGPQGPAGVVDDAALEALQRQITALQQQAACQRIVTTLDIADAIIVKYGFGGVRWVGLNGWTVTRLGLDQDAAQACVGALFGDVPVFGLFGR